MLDGMSELSLLPVLRFIFRLEKHLLMISKPPC